MGDAEGELRIFDAVLPELATARDTEWQARILNNRAMILGQHGEFTAAERDLAMAESLLAGRGADALLATVIHNRGWLLGERGDAAAALATLDRATALYAAIGRSTIEIQRDRAILFADIGLTAEAHEAAASALAESAAGGARAIHAELQLQYARALLADGRPEPAAVAALAAEADFLRQGRPGWATLARHVIVRSRLRSGRADAALAALAADTADELHRAGFRTLAADAAVDAARAALAIGDSTAAERLLAGTSRARSAGTAALRARAWHAEALLRLSRGEPAGAAAALRAGLATVTQAQASLGASELRARIAAVGADLADAGLQLAVASGRARRVLDWAERWRAQALTLPPVNPPADDALTAVLAELRSATVDLDRALLDGGAPTALHRRVSTLERELTRRSRLLTGPSAPALTTGIDAGRLRVALGDRVLVEYVEHRGELWAVVVPGPRRRAALVRLAACAEVAHEVEQLRFGLRRLARRTAAHAGPTTAATSSRLDALALAPLRRHVGDAELVLVASAGLNAVPWAALATIGTRPFVVAPSARVWLAAESRTPPRGHRLLAAGPDLPAAEGELAALEQTYTDAVVLRGPEATASRVRDALDGAALAHIAAHGRFRADNAQFSALHLADGPLFVHDLERLHRAPAVVVLSACQSGLSGVHAGDELLGLAATLLARGTRTLVASVAAVSDEATRHVMSALHARVAAGERPAAALAAVQAESQASPAIAVAAASFVCFGAG